MSTGPSLTIATGRYAHVEPLRARGSLAVAGLDLTLRWHLDRPGHIFHDALSKAAPYDVAEMSLSNCFIAVDRDDRRFVALPVFPSRLFRHSSVYVRHGFNSRDPAERLRIGAVRLTQTATVWIRADIEAATGLRLREAQWFVAEPPRAGADAHDLTIVDGGAEALENLLAEGRLDMLIAVRVPAVFAAARVDGIRADGPRVERLFADPYGMARLQLARTGYVPPMHTLVVRRALVERYPALGTALCDAFEAAKHEALAWLADEDASALPVPLQHGWLQDVKVLLDGPDPWPYGLAANATALADFARALHAQSMTSRPIEPEEVFGNVA